MRDLSFFKGKTVTQLGLGLLGRGVGDAAFLAKHCRKLIVTDMKSAAELQSSLDALKDFTNITYRLGGHDKADFEGVDMVVKGAGVRLDNPFIAHATARDIPVYMSTALYAQQAGLPCIGVTGTRGKTSTTLMIAAILKQAGKNIVLGGNLRGVSTLALLEDTAPYDYAVLELDSWQLQGFDSLGISPAYAAFTTFYPDHMNYYDGDMPRYLRDKTAIFRHQKPGDCLVISPQVDGQISPEDRAAARGRWLVADPLPAAITWAGPGEHNRLNAAVARGVALACGIDEATIADALRSFAGVEGSLQPVRTWRGRTFYNDSNATTQEATLAALTAFAPQDTVLIFGGADKGLPIDGLVAHLRATGQRCVLIKGTGSDRILSALPQLEPVGSMAEAFTAALALAKDGDHIVLSPAFASFGVFKNEYDRSDQFLACVRNLPED